jgi:AcrR family transcriptional regulator
MDPRGQRVYTVHMPRTARPPKNSTADRILRATWRVFERHGEAGVSVRRIAEVVELSPMAMYRHYRSRDALLAALTAEALAGWEARVRAVTGRTAIAWLTRVVEAYLRFALDEPRRYEAAFELRSREVHRFPTDYTSGQLPAVRVILANVDRGLAAGELRGADAVTIALALWGEAHGLIRLYRDGRFDSPRAFEQSYRRCLRLVLGAFVAPTPARTRRARRAR